MIGEGAEKEVLFVSCNLEWSRAGRTGPTRLFSQLEVL